MTMFTHAPADFRAEFKVWRASRPAWGVLIKAIRNDAPRDDLDKSADEAGATPDELRELEMIRRNARQRKTEAAKYPQAKKRLDAMDADVSRLRAAAENATADEYAGRMSVLQQALDHRDVFFAAEVLGPQQAFTYIEEVATPLGLA